MSQTPNLDAARASLQQAIDQANAIVKPIIDAMREAGMLTPAPEPAAAPAVDDDLLRDVGLSFRDAIDRDEDLLDEDTVRFILALEPAQRLRAAWTAEAMGKRFALADVHLQECADRAIRAERERDEARAASIRARRERNHAQALAGPACSCVVNRLAESHDGHCCVAGPGTEPNCHQQEVDAYRSLAEAREALGEIGELVDPWMGFDGSIVDGVRAVIAEVERLRAAQQLPYVGPVTRTDPDEDGWTWLRVGDHRGFFNPHISADDHRLSAARELALAAFLNAEADGTSSDDEWEVREVQLTEPHEGTVWTISQKGRKARMGDGLYWTRKAAQADLDAHREAGRG